MTRTEYMDQLKKYLKKLPYKEFQEAVTFFNEYFDEAGPEREAEIMAELGSPKDAANELIDNMLNRQHQLVGDGLEKPNADAEKRPLYLLIAGVVIFLFMLFASILGLDLRFSLMLLVPIVAVFYLLYSREMKGSVWLVVLGILSLPVLLPLSLLLAGLVLGGMALLFVLILGAIALGIVLFTSGGYLIWEGFSLLSQGSNAFLIGLGSGLSLIGGAILLYILTGFFAYWSWHLLRACFKWVWKRGKRL